GALRIGDAVAVGNSDAANLPDLAHHLIGDLDVRPLALGGAAEIVHHHLASLVGGEQSDLTSATPPGAGADNDFSLTALGHVVPHTLGVKGSAHQHRLRHRTRWANRCGSTQLEMFFRHRPHTPTPPDPTPSVTVGREVGELTLLPSRSATRPGLLPGAA